MLNKLQQQFFMTQQISFNQFIHRKNYVNYTHPMMLDRPHQPTSV